MPFEPFEYEGGECPNLGIRLQFEIRNSSSFLVRGRRKSTKVIDFLISLEDSIGVSFLV